MWALHSGKRHCSSAIRPQATDVYLCQTNLDKAQTTSANASQNAEVPFESGAGTSLVLKRSPVTGYHEPHFPCVELKQIPLITWSFKFTRKKDSYRKLKKQIWKNQPSSQTNVSNKFAKKLTRIPPCKHWWTWSQLGGLMENWKAPFVCACAGPTGANCPLKMA